MKKTRFTEAQIFNILKEYDAGKNVLDVAREHGVSKATIYNWKAKYGGMELNDLKRIKELEEENRKLKHMYAELALDNKMLKDVLGKKF
jgi:putative transposase